jgi:glutamyl-tRNA synthetase
MLFKEKNSMTKKDTITKTARIYALQNAIQFNGQANEKAVIGKVIAALRTEGITPTTIIPIVKEITKQVNTLPFTTQITELQKIAPELLQKEKKERDFSLPDLPDAHQEKVVTRFPPEPNGYLHIGHAKAAIIDYEYARKYEGTFILRFDDTNPENAQLDFYDAQKKDLSWLNITWDTEYNTSDHLLQHYELAQQLITQGDAYICNCSSEHIKQGRYHGTPCACRDKPVGSSLDEWNEMIASTVEKSSILRLRGDLKSTNTAMRDPTLFRIITAPHPLLGTKYSVWPTYDFAGAVEDSIGGVTHPFRTKEYELRDECYFFILDRLGLRKPHLMEFSRLAIEGMPVSKRKIKPLIDEGKVSGFDDIRLPTLRGLHKRGIIPEAIKQFILSQGLSKMESSVTFSAVEAYNRKLLDPQVKRFFFVPDPIKLTVTNAPKKTVKLKLHPSSDLGTRSVTTASTFYISKNDLTTLKKDGIFRLKDLYNVKLLATTQKDLRGSYEGTTLIPQTPKLQWTTDHYIPINIYVPHPLFINEEYNPHSLEVINGYAEPAITTLKHGEIIQFERFGFIRIEKTNDTIIGYFTHK